MTNQKFISRLQRYYVLSVRIPGALPQAITCRAFGAFKIIAQRLVTSC
jgi:hypothetical protein